MKTLDEALECVQLVSYGNPGKADVTTNGVSFTGDISNRDMANLISISQEVIANERAQNLSMFVVRMFEMTVVPVGSPIEDYNFAHFNDSVSLFLTGLAYGIRIGMEMEKP